MKVLDKEKFIEQVINAGFKPTENILKIYEAVFEIVLLAYEQGKTGKQFDILPVKEV